MKQTFFGLFLLLALANCLPVLPEGSNESGFLQESVEEPNITIPKDLYVIKTIVYEVGILTEARNDTNSTETNEEVDFTFFNPAHNGSTIDLSNIPVPIQTNVSGVSITGIAPISFGSFDLNKDPEKQLNGTVFPNLSVSVKHNLTTLNAEKGREILRQLSPILGINVASNKTNIS